VQTPSFRLEKRLNHFLHAVLRVDHEYLAPFVERQARMRDVERDHVADFQIGACGNPQIGVLIHQAENFPAFIGGDIARRRRARTIPFKLETGTFGNITTLPSGCTKNLIWSPGPTCRWSRIALGIVACPLTLRVDFMMFPFPYILADVIPLSQYT